jgi:hypothetical protein
MSGILKTITEKLNMFVANSKLEQQMVVGFVIIIREHVWEMLVIVHFKNVIILFDL